MRNFRRLWRCSVWWGRFGGRGADPEDDEVARCAALRRPAHHWSPTSDIVNMFQDTLVAMDWDGKTAIPYLAKSWTVSEDGKLYTFKLRDDVTFCSGKKFTADDVVYTFKRLTDPETKAPLAWRAGNLKEIRAPDPYTVEYELNEPYSDLLLNLTMFTTAIHNKESVEALGKDYGIRRSTAPGLVLRKLAAAHRNRAEAPRRLQVGARRCTRTRAR